MNSFNGRPTFFWGISHTGKGIDERKDIRLSRAQLIWANMESSETSLRYGIE